MHHFSCQLITVAVSFLFFSLYPNRHVQGQLCVRSAIKESGQNNSLDFFTIFLILKTIRNTNVLQSLFFSSCVCVFVVWWWWWCCCASHTKINYHYSFFSSQDNIVMHAEYLLWRVYFLIPLHFCVLCQRRAYFSLPKTTTTMTPPKAAKKNNSRRNTNGEGVALV